MAQRSTRIKRIGIYDGKFDPIHYGHLLCAEWSRQEFQLDRVLFLTCKNPPNKKTGVTSAEDRHEMVVAALSEHPYFEASRLGIEHGGTGYTLMAVEAVRQKYGKDVELFYLLSSEYLDPSHQWYLANWIGGKELFKLCKFLIFPRHQTEIAQLKKWAKLIPQADIEVLYVPSPELSSTQIRELVQQGRSIRYTTPMVVQEMIRKRGYYRGDMPAQNTTACVCQRPKEVRSVAIFGSQFDPINYWDLLAAEAARQDYQLDRVLFVTSANPPNNRKVAVSAEARHDMVVAAVSDNPYFDASRIDLDRHTKSYALLTVEQVREQFGDNVQISWIISSEYLNPRHPWYLGKWMGAATLLEMVRFLVIPQDLSEIPQIEKWIKLLPDGRFSIINHPVLPISSRTIRDLVARGRSIWYTTPWSVQQAISKTGLYHPTSRQRRRKSK